MSLMEAEEEETHKKLLQTYVLTCPQHTRHLDCLSAY